MKYHAHACVSGSKYLGEFEADSPAEAEELAFNSDAAGITLCLNCSRECEDPAVTAIEITTADGEPAVGEVQQPVESTDAEVVRLRARVDELLAANNAEVERRRHAERQRDSAVADLEVLGADREALRDEVARLEGGGKDGQ